MDTITLPDRDQLYVIVGGRQVTSKLLNLAARLALRGPLFILDCGNLANPYPLARELRRITRDPVAALQRIQVARAFTCYQVVTLLQEVSERRVQSPVLIFDLLSTFYDESVPYREGLRLLEQSLDCIRGLHSRVSQAVSVRPPPGEFPERRAFLQEVCNLADVLWVEEAPAEITPQQLAFF